MVAQLTKECHDWWQQYAEANASAEAVARLNNWRDQLGRPVETAEVDVAELQQLMEKIKDTVVGLKQEDLLRSIRASPAWASDAALQLRSGNLWLQADTDDNDPDADMPSQVAALIRRSGVAGGGALRQRWKRRYFVLSEDWLEFYREVETKGLGKRLERICRERTSAVKETAPTEDSCQFELLVKRSKTGELQTWTLASESAESVDAWLACFKQARTSSQSGAVELQQKLKAFSHAQGFGKDEVIARIDKLVDFASDRNMLDSSPAEVLKAFADDPDYDPLVGQNLRAEDELGADLRRVSSFALALLHVHWMLSSGRAFTLLRAAVDRFVEAETLNPSRESLDLVRFKIEATGLPRAAAISAKVEALQHEPQSSPVFEIKPKFISPSDWAAAVNCMQALDRAQDDWPLPSVAAQVIQSVVDSIFATFRTEHPTSSATMGADDLNPGPPDHARHLTAALTRCTRPVCFPHAPQPSLAELIRAGLCAKSSSSSFAGQPSAGYRCLSR